MCERPGSGDGGATGGHLFGLREKPGEAHLETDCSAAANMISEVVTNRSPVAVMVGDIRQLLANREHKISLIRREQNKASHALAQMGRSRPRTAVWLGSVLEEIDVLCRQECNDSI